jgi:tetratricopeptide (TPR) repeat protein
LIAMSIGAGILAAVAQHSGGAESSLATLSVMGRVENAILAYVVYLAKLIVPRNLAVFYPHPEAIAFSQVGAAGVLLVLITWGAFRVRRGSPYLWMGWLWFLGTLVPVIGLVQIGAQAMADRYSYFPSVGLFVAIVWGVHRLGTTVVGSLAVRQTVFAVLAVGYVAILAWVARVQVGYWSDTRTLFTHALAVTEDNWNAHLVLGTVALESGDESGAQAEFLEVIRLQPRNAKAYNNLGETVLHQNPEAAIGLYEKAVEFEPGAPEYHVNLAVALAMTGRRAAAIGECREALRLRPGFAPALAGLADLTGGRAGDSTQP